MQRSRLLLESCRQTTSDQLHGRRFLFPLQTPPKQESRPLTIRRFVVVSFGMIILKVISDDLAILHHETDAFQFGNVCDWISCNGYEISKFPWLNRAHAILPAQHFRGIRGAGANHSERRHSRIAQLDQGPSARLPARLSRIKPTHVRASSELHARL